jgi:undecaprenyl-diphosphatase
MFDKLAALDTNLFLLLNSWHTPFWDHTMWFISGKIEWLPLYVLVLAFIIYHYKKQSILIIAGILLAVTLADQLAVHAFKDVFERLRPSHNPNLVDRIHLVNGYKGGLYGFVSNHAANTFAFALFVCLLLKNKWFTVGIFFWAILVSYSRIYLGVHYPGDVLCGAILGSLIGWLVFIIYDKIKDRIDLRNNKITEM